MTLTEALVVLSGLGIGYWFVSMFLRPARSDMADADREAARERPEGLGGAPRDDDRPWHEVLGVLPDATDAEIVEAYRARVAQYHPDRVAQMGPEIRALAERKTAQINRAYGEARKRR